MVAGRCAQLAGGGALAAAAGREMPVPEAEPIAPSRLLGEPEVYLPLVQMPVSGHRDDAPLVEHNNDLAGRHRRLLEDVDTTLPSYPVHVYHDPGHPANRPAPSIEPHPHPA